MSTVADRSISIRKALPEEFSRLGQMTVAVYADLPGMPSVAEQPEYYSMLLDVAKRDSNPAISIFAALSAAGELLGSVDFIDDMKQYGSGGAACNLSEAAGIRLLAVRPEFRGMGLGKALTTFCIEQARQRAKFKVVLHTTRAMETAWTMYERMGFQRYPEIDFQQGHLDVFGFKLDLTAALTAK